MHSKKAHNWYNLTEEVQSRLYGCEPGGMIHIELAQVVAHGKIGDIEDDSIDDWHNEDIQDNPDLYNYKHSGQYRIKAEESRIYVYLSKFTYPASILNGILPM